MGQRIWTISLLKILKMSIEWQGFWQILLKLSIMLAQLVSDFNKFLKKNWTWCNEGKEEAKNETKISFDSSILHKKEEEEVKFHCWIRDEKFMRSYNLHRVIVHIHIFIDDSGLFLKTWCDALMIENM